MSEEIRKKIEEYIEEAYVGLNDDEKQAPFTVGDLKAETRDDIEFGYQLGYEEAMKEHGKVMQYSTPAAAVQNIHVVTMTSESKAPSQDELWEEVVSVCLQNYGPYRVHPYDSKHEEFKKRYRITRI